MKNYRTINGSITRVRRAVYEAYDKGYSQGKKDYQRTYGRWSAVFIGGRYTNFECSVCKKFSITKYLFCPNCGSPMTEESYGADKA